MIFLRALVLALALAMAGKVALAVESGNPSSTRHGRIVVLGDSITAGYGLPNTEAYPAVLQGKVDEAKLPYTVSNAGVSGDTTAGGLRRLDWALKGGASVLVIALGGNDGLRGVPTTQTEANLTALVQKAQAKSPGITVLVAGMQMPGSMGATYVEAYRSLFPRVAQATGAKLVPYLLEGVGGITKLNQPDLIHPTAEGQRRVADNVWAVLRPVLAARAQP